MNLLHGAHLKRGREGMDAIGIAPLFEGISVHDAFPSYQGYRSTEALCKVHHLRDLTFIEEELKQDWAKDMKDLLLDMKEAVEQARVRGQPALETAVLAALLTRYERIVQAGFQINPLIEKPSKTKQYKRMPGRPRQGPARNLLDRFSTRKWDVLRFLLDFTVPFDNNQAERDLRMIKVQQKVSGCFRTSDGLISFCRIRSYFSTLRKQGMPIFTALEQALLGHPVFSLLTPPEQILGMTHKTKRCEAPQALRRENGNALQVAPDPLFIFKWLCYDNRNYNMEIPRWAERNHQRHLR